MSAGRPQYPPGSPARPGVVPAGAVIRSPAPVSSPVGSPVSPTGPDDDAPAPFAGVLAALGVLMLQAGVLVPASVMVVLGLATAGCASDSWTYPVCTAGTGWLLGALVPAVVGLGAVIGSIVALANARRRPQRAGSVLGVTAIALIALVTLVPALAGVPYFG
ncbi:hypothetical protein Bcav_1373 [Beutenbergia cavernae DSM 12333]|uniref:Uncharacterized protein n=1 Tax=Beutenbergia cavernae (strain ATCC BAA-8 / DSM 12333 / CCUG 43141 / JCM 11478 / NBRC 16432 / NCIMB 13614 / HKI 0122) TaxID=471853 RepID=C5C2E6_BEUC1|nr:hypothetical protein [Beutenbergia cavernae]ACQ79632.1 hypothetical protein Bcav_1373 [Beutenbergia cavernae DSM 12333]